MKDLYAILGVERDAGIQDVRKAYKKLALSEHPDKGGDAERMALLSKAYAILSDPAERRLFDAEWEAFQEEDDETGETAQSIITDYLDSAGIPYSEAFKKQHAELVERYQRTPLERGVVASYFQSFQSELYELTHDGVLIGRYSDIFLYINAKEELLDETFFDARENLSDEEVLEECRQPLTSVHAVGFFLQFLQGAYYGNKKRMLAAYIVAQMEELKGINPYAPEYILYEAIVSIISIKVISIQDKDTLLLSIQKITDYAIQTVSHSMPIMVRLLQNKYFRNLFSQAIHLYWQPMRESSLSNNLTESFNGVEAAKTILDNLRMQFSRRGDDNEDSDSLTQLVQYVRLLSRFEKDFDRKTDPNCSAAVYREKAFHLLDWIPAFIGKAEQKILVNMFLQAGVYFQKASEVEVIPAVQMADEKLAFKMYATTFTIGHYATPNIEQYAYIPALKYIALFKFLDPLLAEIVPIYQHRALVVSDIFPFFQAPQSNIAFLTQGNRMLYVMREFLHALVAMIEHKKSCPDDALEFDHQYSTVLYQAYEACLKNWYEEHYDKSAEDRLRFFLMEELLRDERWVFNDLQMNLDPEWMMVDRDENGWMQSIRRLPLIDHPDVDKIRAIEGVEINHKTGEISFAFKTCAAHDSPSDYVLTIFDVMDMLAEDMKGAFFSLDPVNPDQFYHPFNKMRFAPDEVYNTPLFTTMLLTDYILKFLTVGGEVQGKPPYSIRSVDHLIDHLPSYLRKIIHDFHQEEKSGSMHRFWIEAVEVPLAIAEDTLSVDGIQRVALGTIQMVVKKHQMRRGPDGTLVDQDEDEEGWLLYVLTSSQKKALDEKRQVISADAIILIEGLNTIYFYENGVLSEPLVVKNYEEQFKRLVKRARDSDGKIINNQETTDELYRVTKEITRQADKSHQFSPEYVFAKEFTLHYNEFAQYFPEFGRLRELSKATALIRVMNSIRESNKEHVDKLKELLSNIEHWRKRQAEIQKVIDELRKTYQEKYDARHTEVYRELSDNFFTWRSELAGFSGEKLASLREMRRKIGVLRVDPSSSEVQKACQHMHDQMRDDVISRYGRGAWDSNTSRQAWSVINPKKSEFATQISSMRRTQYREQLSELFSSMRSSVSDSRYNSLIDAFLDENIEPITTALADLNASRMKEQIQEALRNPSRSDIDAALRNDVNAIKRITAHLLTYQFSQYKRDLDEEIVKLGKIIEQEKQGIRKKCDELKKLDERFEELGVGRPVDPAPPEFKEKCSWVPASIWSHPHTGRTNIVYGGVNVQARINVLASNSAMHARTMQSAFSGNNQAFANRDAMLRAQGFQQHHIVSETNRLTKNHQLFSLAGVSLNSRVNTIYLPTNPSLHDSRSIHLGRHTGSYSNAIAERMNGIVQQGQAAGWTQEQYRSETRTFISELRQGLRSGDIGLNQHHRPWATKW